MRRRLLIVTAICSVALFCAGVLAVPPFVRYHSLSEKLNGTMTVTLGEYSAKEWLDRVARELDLDVEACVDLESGPPMAGQFGDVVVRDLLVFHLRAAGWSARITAKHLRVVKDDLHYVRLSFVDVLEDYWL